VFDVINYLFLYEVEALRQLQQRHCQMKRPETMPNTAGHGEKRRWCIYCNMFKCLHSLKGMVGSELCNRIVSIRIVFQDPITSTAMPCWYKHLTVMCCHHQKPREANILVFHALTRTFRKGCTNNYECDISVKKQCFD
jgi:hypothetical protein